MPTGLHPIGRIAGWVRSTVGHRRVTPMAKSYAAVKVPGSKAEPTTPCGPRARAAAIGLAVMAGIAAGSPLPDTITRIKPSIVAVGTVQHLRSPSSKFMGTGFVVGNGRYIITNAHVVPRNLDREHKEFLAVFVSTGQKKKKVLSRRAEEVAKDSKHDLSLLRIVGTPLPALKLGNSERVREGESYVFTGFPIGPVLGALYPVTSQAMISSVTPIALPVDNFKQMTRRLRKQLASPFMVFQLDAVAYPGNSGSPVYAPKTGAVVAVVNAVHVKETRETILQKPSGITYAIPVKYAKRLMSKAGIAP